MDWERISSTPSCVMVEEPETNAGRIVAVWALLARAPFYRPNDRPTDWSIELELTPDISNIQGKSKKRFELWVRVIEGNIIKKTTWREETLTSSYRESTVPIPVYLYIPTYLAKSALMSPISLIISGATHGSEDFLEWTDDFCARFMWLKYKYRYCWSELRIDRQEWITRVTLNYGLNA